MVLLQLCAGVDKESGAAQLGSHVGQLKADCLVKADGLSELNALLCVVEGAFVGSLSDSKGLGGVPIRPPSRVAMAILKPCPSFPRRFSLGTLHIVKNQLGGRGGTDSHLVIVVAESEALPAFLYDESRDASRSDIRSRHGEYHIGVSLRRVCDEDLTAV